MISGTDNVSPIRQVNEVKPDKIKITITTDLATHSAFKAAALAKGLTFQELLKDMMQNYFETQNAKQDVRAR